MFNAECDRDMATTVAPALIELLLIEPPALIEPRSASQVKQNFFPRNHQKEWKKAPSLQKYPFLDQKLQPKLHLL